MEKRLNILLRTTQLVQASNLIKSHPQKIQMQILRILYLFDTLNTCSFGYIMQWYGKLLKKKVTINFGEKEIWLRFALGNTKKKWSF